MEFATKPALGTAIITGAVGAGVPFAWAAADEVYGRGAKLREACEKEKKGYVVAVPVNFAVTLPCAPRHCCRRRRHGLAGRLRFYPGDFFADPLPTADVLIFGHILHDWSLEEKLTLLRKAYQALPDGGAVIVYDAIIDHDRRANTFGLLMSVNMLIETPAGADYTAADCRAWLARTGYRTSYTQPLTGPDSMIVGIK